MADRVLGFQYATPAQQREASTLGMWAFLATEILFLGTLVAAYLNYRIYYPQELIEAAKHTKIVLGTTNTAVLLTSSACMAMAVRSMENQARRATVAWLLATGFLGILFIGIKGFEYFEEFQDRLVPALNFDLARYGPVGELFFTWYFAITGFHALHLFIGILFVFLAAALLAADRFPPMLSLRIIGLYWHFVDIVWIFLFPLIYLAGRNM
jgi:cytochrome c oxidase subunit 3